MLEETKNLAKCLQCQRSDFEVPLISLQHRGRPVWICTQCLPILIHNPNRLATKFPSGKEVTTGPLV